jgi:hypothetical protein
MQWSPIESELQRWNKWKRNLLNGYRRLRRLMNLPKGRVRVKNFGIFEPMV